MQIQMIGEQQHGYEARDRAATLCGGGNLPAIDPEQEHRGSGNSIERNGHDKSKEKFPAKEIG